MSRVACSLKPKAQGTAGDSPKKIRATLCQLRPGPLIRGIPAAVKQRKGKHEPLACSSRKNAAADDAARHRRLRELSTRRPQGLSPSCRG
jgi:hypothetical protein